MSTNHRTSPFLRSAAGLLGLAALAGVALAGCGAIVGRAQLSRPAAIVHLPPHWRRGQQAPLVIALHPSGSSPAGFEAQSGWDRVADQHRFIVAYLGSARPAWKSPSNVGYISAQIDRLRATYNVDPRRVYVTGFSAGAYISYFVGCRLGAKVAGIAAVSAGMRRQRCRPARPVSELTIIGSQDIIPLSGTARFPAPAAVTARWRSLDHCPNTPPNTSVVGPVTERTWRSCVAGSAVGYYLIQGGTHTYPSSQGPPSAGPDARFNASEAIWAFFDAHPRRR
jgi:polyhydroxybutyrate depolymerase